VGAVKLYLAHNYEARIGLRETIKVLAELGHSVTSRWITDDAHDGVNATTARVDLDDIKTSDALVLFVNQFGDRPGRGKYVELGYALGIGKKVFLYGNLNNCVFYHLPEVQWVSSLTQIH
jgi:nucleoside 2-deoxyribosyltransferase